MGLLEELFPKREEEESIFDWLTKKISPESKFEDAPPTTSSLPFQNEEGKEPLGVAFSTFDLPSLELSSTVTTEEENKKLAESISKQFKSYDILSNLTKSLKDAGFSPEDLRQITPLLEEYAADDKAVLKLHEMVSYFYNKYEDKLPSYEKLSDELKEVTSNPTLPKVNDSNELIGAQKTLELMKLPSLEELPEDVKSWLEQNRPFFSAILLLPQEIQPKALVLLKQCVEKDKDFLPELTKLITISYGAAPEEIDKNENLTSAQKILIKNILSGKYKEFSLKDALNLSFNTALEAGTTFLAAGFNVFAAIPSALLMSSAVGGFLQKQYLNVIPYAIEFIKTHENDKELLESILKGNTPKELKEFYKSKIPSNIYQDTQLPLELEQKEILFTTFRKTVQDLLKGNIDPRIDFSYNAWSILGELGGVALSPLGLSQRIAGKSFKKAVEEVFKFFGERELINFATQASAQGIYDLFKGSSSTVATALSIGGGLISGGLASLTLSKQLQKSVLQIRNEYLNLTKKIEEVSKATEELKLGQDFTTNYTAFIDSLKNTTEKTLKQLNEFGDLTYESLNSLKENPKIAVLWDKFENIGKIFSDYIEPNVRKHIVDLKVAKVDFIDSLNKLINSYKTVRDALYSPIQKGIFKVKEFENIILEGLRSAEFKNKLTEYGNKVNKDFIFEVPKLKEAFNYLIEAGVNEVTAEKTILGKLMKNVKDIKIESIDNLMLSIKDIKDSITQKFNKFLDKISKQGKLEDFNKILDSLKRNEDFLEAIRENNGSISEKILSKVPEVNEFIKSVKIKKDEVSSFREGLALYLVENNIIPDTKVLIPEVDKILKTVKDELDELNRLSKGPTKLISSITRKEPPVIETLLKKLSENEELVNKLKSENFSYERLKEIPEIQNVVKSLNLSLIDEDTIYSILSYELGKKFNIANVETKASRSLAEYKNQLSLMQNHLPPKLVEEQSKALSIYNRILSNLSSTNINKLLKEAEKLDIGGKDLSEISLRVIKSLLEIPVELLKQESNLILKNINLIPEHAPKNALISIMGLGKESLDIFKRALAEVKTEPISIKDTSAIAKLKSYFEEIFLPLYENYDRFVQVIYEATRRTLKKANDINNAMKDVNQFLTLFNVPETVKNTLFKLNVDNVTFSESAQLLNHVGIDPSKLGKNLVTIFSVLKDDFTENLKKLAIKNFSSEIPVEFSDISHALNKLIELGGMNGRYLLGVINSFMQSRNVAVRLFQEDFDKFLGNLAASLYKNLPPHLKPLIEAPQNAFLYLIKSNEDVNAFINEVANSALKIKSFIDNINHASLLKNVTQENEHLYASYYNNIRKEASNLSKLLEKFSFSPFDALYKELSYILDNLPDLKEGILPKKGKVENLIYKLNVWLDSLINKLTALDVFTPTKYELYNYILDTFKSAFEMKRHKYPGLWRTVVSPLANSIAIAKQLALGTTKIKRKYMQILGGMDAVLREHFKPIAESVIDNIIIKGNLELLDDVVKAGQVGAQAENLKIFTSTFKRLLDRVRELNIPPEEIKKTLLSSLDIEEFVKHAYNDPNAMNKMLFSLAYNNLLGLTLMRAVENPNSKAFNILPEAAKKVVLELRDILDDLGKELSARGLLSTKDFLGQYIHYFYHMFNPKTKSALMESKLFKMTLADELWNYAISYKEYFDRLRAEIIEDIYNKLSQNLPIDSIVFDISSKYTVLPKPQLNVIFDTTVKEVIETTSSKLAKSFPMPEDVITLKSEKAPLLEEYLKLVPAEKRDMVANVLKLADLTELYSVKLSVPSREDFLGKHLDSVFKVLDKLINDTINLDSTPYEKLSQLIETYPKSIFAPGISESRILNPRSHLDFSLKRFYMLNLNPIEATAKAINYAYSLIWHYDLFKTLNLDLNLVVDKEKALLHPADYIPLSQDKFLRNLPEPTKRILYSFIPEKEVYIHKSLVETLKDLYHFQTGFGDTMTQILKFFSTLQLPFKLCHVIFNPAVMIGNIIGNTIMAAYGVGGSLSKGIAVLMSGVKSILNKDEFYQTLWKKGAINLHPYWLQEMGNIGLPKTTLDKGVSYLINIYDLFSKGKVINSFSFLNALFDDAVRVGLYKYYMANGIPSPISPRIKIKPTVDMAIEKARSYSFDYVDIPSSVKFIRDLFAPFISFPFLSVRVFLNAMKESPIEAAALTVAPAILSIFLDQQYDINFNWDRFILLSPYVPLLSLNGPFQAIPRMMFSAPWFSLASTLIGGRDLWTGVQIYDPNKLGRGTLSEQYRELVKLSKGMINWVTNQYVPDLYRDLLFMIVYGTNAADINLEKIIFTPTTITGKALGLYGDLYKQPGLYKALNLLGINVSEYDFPQIQLEILNRIRGQVATMQKDVAYIKSVAKGNPLIWSLQTPSQIKASLTKRMEDLEFGTQNLNELVKYLEDKTGLKNYVNKSKLSNLTTLFKNIYKFVYYDKDSFIENILNQVPEITFWDKINLLER